MTKKKLEENNSKSNASQSESKNKIDKLEKELIEYKNKFNEPEKNNQNLITEIKIQKYEKSSKENDIKLNPLEDQIKGQSNKEDLEQEKNILVKTI